MHSEILDENQLKLLPLLKEFSNSFYLAGGTAIALQIGHRRSVDFDLFAIDKFDLLKIKKKIKGFVGIEKVLVENVNELTVIIFGVKLTFYKYPFYIKPEVSYEDYIKMPSLLSLSAMKIYAIGGRSKWKDYVDLYYLIDIYGLKKIIEVAESIFGSEFNKKLLRAQLSYFKDIDYSEIVNFLNEDHITDEDIRRKLVGYSLELDSSF